MKAATTIAVMLAAISSFPMISMQQEPAQPPTQSAPATPNAQAAPNMQAGQSSAPATAPPNLEMRPVTAELEKKLDTKSAKTGDSVVVKTKQDVKTADGTNIPKGSRLVGHITAIQARGEGRQNSQVAIQFDRAELKGGQSLPIESVIQSISPTEQGAGAGASSSGYGGSMESAPVGGSVSTPTSGGGMNNSTMNNPGMTNNRPTTMTSSPAEAAAQPSNGSGISNAPAVGTVVSQKGNIAIRTTAIPGVLLANNVTGQPFSNASGMFLGANRDVHLDSGTQMVLAVATVPGPSGSGGSTSNR